MLTLYFKPACDAIPSCTSAQLSSFLHTAAFSYPVHYHIDNNEAVKGTACLTYTEIYSDFICSLKEVSGLQCAPISFNGMETR